MWDRAFISSSMTHFTKLKEVFVAHFVKNKNLSRFFKKFLSCPEIVLEKNVSNRKNPFSEIRVSIRASYLPTENTYEESEIGYFS